MGGFASFRNLRGLIKHGVRRFRFLGETWTLGQFRGGTLVGKDFYGNHYYEMEEKDARRPFYRKRYVMTVDGVDEATEIPAEWHGWLHYTVDEVPKTKDGSAPVKTYDWQVPHVHNLTGSSGKYVPYSTTIPKIGEYDGGSS